MQHDSRDVSTPATEFAPCHYLLQPWQCNSQKKTRNTTRLKCCACHAKWTWTRPKCCTCHEKWKSASENLAKVLRLSHKTTFDTIRPATQNDIEPVWTPSKMTGFAASLIDTATLQENQRIETRHVGTSKRAFRARLPELFTLCSYKIDAFLWVFSWTPKSTTSKSLFGARLLQTPRVKREPLLRIREKKQMNIIKTWVPVNVLWKNNPLIHTAPITDFLHPQQLVVQDIALGNCGTDLGYCSPIPYGWYS